MSRSRYQVPVRIPDRYQIEEAAKSLAGCKKIVILAGAGARGARAELEQVAERLGAVIIKPLLGKDCIPDTSPYTTSGIGVVGTRPSVEALNACDGLLIVGSCFPYIEFLPKPGQAVGVQIDDKPEHIGLRYPVEIGLVGDARATLRELLTKLPRNEDRAFLSQAQESMKAWWALMEERGTSDHMPMCPQVISWKLPDLIAPDAIICGDSGTVTTWAARMRLRDDQRFSFSGTMCSMMAAIPYSIGAAHAFPDRQIIAFTGDGSATMIMGELATIAQYKLPVKVVVMKNNTLGLIKWEQMLYLGNPEYGVDLHPVDFVKVAEACGLRAARIENPGTARRQLQDALALEGPTLIECVVDPLEPPWPPVITTDEQKKLVTALARGERNRTPIGLSMGRHAAQEFTFSESPFGVAGRILDRVTGRKLETAGAKGSGSGQESLTAMNDLNTLVRSGAKSGRIKPLAPPRPDYRKEARELEAHLKPRIAGEVRFDTGTRAAYATDHSIYRAVPVGVIVPRNVDDVLATVDACRARSVPILGRGCGSSLSGQSTNVAVVIDFSKYMNRILAFDPEGGMAKVEPGVINDTLRNKAKQHGMTFAPDPATHQWCTLGGNIGNNSCGAHTVMGGKTVDNVIELDIVTYDGLRMRVGETTPDRSELILKAGGLRANIYQGLKSIADRYGDSIRQHYPHIPRRVSGYNLPANCCFPKAKLGC